MWLMQPGSEGSSYRAVIDKPMICCDVPRGRAAGPDMEVVRPQTNCICLTSLSCGAIMG